MPLTDKEIRALKPAERLYRRSDGGGLMIEVSPTGAKKFRIAYRLGGRQQTLFLGAYPDLSLARARYLREQVKNHLALGEDPKQAMDLQRPAEPGQRVKLKPVHLAVPPGQPAEDVPEGETFRHWLAEYLGKRQREGAATATLSKLRLHAAVIEAAMGGTAIHRATAQDVIRACQHYERAGRLNSAQAVRILCSQVFRFAIAHGAASADPAAPARDAIAKAPKKNHAAVTDPRQVGALMRAIRAGSEIRYPVVRAGLLLSAYLFPRNAQLRNMRWDQIDGAVWTVPGWQMKTRREHLVPLPRQALEVLEWIRPITGSRPLVLYSSTSRSGLMSENTLNKALDALGYDKTTHRQHGFRTTFSTNMNEMGWNPNWIEMQLAHVDADKVRGVYNKALYLPGRTRMMQAYADWLDERAADGG